MCSDAAPPRRQRRLALARARRRRRHRRRSPFRSAPRGGAAGSSPSPRRASSAASPTGSRSPRSSADPLGLPIPHTALIPAQLGADGRARGHAWSAAACSPRSTWREEIGRVDLADLLARGAARLTRARSRGGHAGGGALAAAEVPPQAVARPARRALRQLLAARPRGARGWPPCCESRASRAGIERIVDGAWPGAGRGAGAPGLPRGRRRAGRRSARSAIASGWASTRASGSASPSFSGSSTASASWRRSSAGLREVAEDPRASRAPDACWRRSPICPARLRADPALAARVEAAKRELLASAGGCASSSRTRPRRSSARCSPTSAGQRSELIAWMAERLERARRDAHRRRGPAPRARPLGQDAPGRAVERHHGRIAGVHRERRAGARARGRGAAHRGARRRRPPVHPRQRHRGGRPGGRRHLRACTCSCAACDSAGRRRGVARPAFSRTLSGTPQSHRGVDVHVTRLKIATASLAVGVILGALTARRARHQSDAEIGRHHQRHAARGPPAGLRHPRDVDHLDRLAVACRASTTSCSSTRSSRSRASDTIIGELAEKWSWQDNYRNLVFFLRKNVKWHDGQPFTSKDVKFTFDMLREAPDAAGQAPDQPAQGLVRQRRGHRGARPPHGGLPPQAAPALAPDDARLRLHADLRRPRAARRATARLRRHRALQAQGVAEGRVRRVREEPRLLRQGPALPRRPQVRRHRGARHADRGAPGGPARRRVPRRDHQDDRRAAQEGGAAARRHAGRPERERQHHHEHRRSRPSTI